jgi:prephenate dehydrogenase
MTSEGTEIAVLGAGLIGTSIAMAGLRAGHRVRAFDVDDRVLRVAADRAGFEPSADPEACVRGAHLVFVCTPIGTTAGVVVQALEADPVAVVSDVGSVKSQVVAEVEGAVDPGTASRFVGGHPMGGSERSGPETASPSILDGIAWVLTPSERTAPSAVASIEAWVRLAGARPVRMDPARHDRLVAIVSHLPQAASTALMGLAADEEAGEPEILLLAAGGFRDLTRLAASSPGLWRDILLSNRDAFAEAIDRYVERLEGLRDVVVAGDRDAIERAFDEAKRARLTLAAKPQVKSGVAVLQVLVPDRPGVLADLTATLGRRGVNIEDLQIVHSREGGRGTVHLTVAADAAEEADAALAGAGFDPTRLA